MHRKWREIAIFLLLQKTNRLNSFFSCLKFINFNYLPNKKYLPLVQHFWILKLSS